MAEALAHHGAAKCAIDIALHDLRGKLMGQPAYRLLGGAARPRVTPYVTLFNVAAGREVAPELIQQACTAQALAAEIVAPPELRDEVAATYRKAAARY